MQPAPPAVHTRDYFTTASSGSQRVTIPTYQVNRQPVLTSASWVQTHVCVPEVNPHILGLQQTSASSKEVRIHSAVNLHYQVVSGGLPNFPGRRILLPTRLDISAWRKELVIYSDQHLCDFLQFEFPIGYTRVQFPAGFTKNHQSSLAYPSYVDQYLQKEIQHGVIAGPFKAPPISTFHTSPLMTREKRDSDA